MKISKRGRMTSSLSRVAPGRDVHQEIQVFLRAVGSYSDRFARDPELSFEQHFFRIAATYPLFNRGGRRRG
jgi:hypothetical protein